MNKIQLSHWKRNLSVALMSVGIVGLLGTVCAYTPTIPAGETSYQWLWCGWASIIFAVCVLLATGLSAKGVHFFHHSVAWGLILMGGIEAVWGLHQIYGFTTSNHSLYAVTGSFYNPGPYSGYLALVFPVCLYEWLRTSGAGKHAWGERAGHYFSGLVLCLLLCVLPAGMSRSAWLAAISGSVLVCNIHYSWSVRLQKVWKKHRAKVVAVGILLAVLLIVGSFGIYRLKADSAKGRLFMWKISCLAVMEKPLCGHGVGSFVDVYGQSQEAYFAKGDYSKDEEHVAGSPEYAFNEYLRVAVECGIPVLLLVLGIVGVCLHQGIRRRRIGICGGLLSLLVFSFSSYPTAYPCFLVAFLCLLVACFLGTSSRWMLVIAFVTSVSGGWLIHSNTYETCRKWSQCRMLYGMKAYGPAKDGYEELYPFLKHRPRFLFEYGHCLHKLKEYNHSTRILEKAMMHSCDPMILNIIGKNYQAEEEYEKAEEYLIRSTHRLPGRIYPYYLLVKLYAEPEYRQPDKLKRVAEIVLIKEPKVQSTAVKEMKEEVKKIIVNEESIPNQ
nr:O-antigen ligase family protein [Bacteroides pyogenes]